MTYLSLCMSYLYHLLVYDLPLFVHDLCAFQGGAQQVSELLAKSIGLENVHLGEPVSAIHQVSCAKFQLMRYLGERQRLIEGWPPEPIIPIENKGDPEFWLSTHVSYDFIIIIIINPLTARVIRWFCNLRWKSSYDLPMFKNNMKGRFDLPMSKNRHSLCLQHFVC